MNQIRSHYPVVVVGGGPVGLASSLMLSRLGVEHLLLERHEGTSIHPKAVGLNQRTVEILRQLGLGEELAAAAAPPSTVSRTGWYTSFGGSTELHGREIASRDAWGGGQYAEEYAAASPAPYTILPQIRLEPLLRATAEAQPQADVRFATGVTALAPDADGADVTVLVDGHEQVVRADYVVGADGGRMVADALGVTVSGPTNLVDMVSAHFGADLTDAVPSRENLISWFVNPDHGGSIGSGYLYHLGPWDEQGRSEEWVFACGFLADDPDRFDEEAMAARIGRSLGLPDLEVDLHSISHWYIQSVVADSFTEGRCFLVGDAAHRIPPWGALGLNTGVQDAHNLTWKIALALADPRTAGLLDSYEQERRPVAQSVAASSLHNFQSHGGVIDAAIGLRPDLPPEEGWERLRTLWSGSEEGQRLQAALDEAVAFMDREFHAHGAENGFAYVDGALCPDPEASALPEDTLVYRPTTRPGHHVPHAWLEGRGSRCSTLDLPAPGRFALLVDAEADTWRAAVDGVDHPLAGLLDVVAVGAGGSWEDPDGSWSSLREVGPGGAVLVRPDTVVAWRSTDLPADPAAALGAALAEVLEPASDLARDPAREPA
ncbi:hypothetical protein BJF80_13780 [Serinicoccus sp. CUA-874]|uniref:FAD-dependent monooxygenase n=1 Tax=Serinicoccus sp. CUA-874 TaxID=1517939 RepID=UPI0009605C04|nr:FAD-dependent monooxygenase [Serinicoccus sp. CUA-874]OLT18915.1 hypothetical protein BJF80_13780 [Serinicoccus sp. CUA-874]